MKINQNASNSRMTSNNNMNIIHIEFLCTHGGGDKELMQIDWEIQAVMASWKYCF